MPPPHFSATASGATNGVTSGGQISSQLSDLPKVQRQLTKDVLQQLRYSLVPHEGGGAVTNTNTTVARNTTASAYEAIRKLVADPALQPSEEANNLQTSASGRPKTQGNAVSAQISGSSADVGAQIDEKLSANVALRRNVNHIINTALFDLFSDDMDQASRPLTQLLISFLHALQPVLDPKCVVLQWWDVLLRPALKNPHCNPSIARKAHTLVIWAMRATSASHYVDEPAPTPVWPAQKAPASTSAAVEMSRASRKPGDAPYPTSSTRSVSTTRSSGESEARRRVLFSTKLASTSSADPLRRFTQRIFDMYTSEASSSGMRDIEDDDIKDVDADEPSPSSELSPDPMESAKQAEKGIQSSTNELETGPTWKGNLEAIILTFGEECPKRFFHHLSESFLDPPARIPILLLLTIFFRISSLHAYYIVSTPFVRLLILSLQLDTSKTCASLGAFALATLIPHIPNWIANGGAGGLPALLSILARIIDWRKLGPQWEERTDALLDADGEPVEEWSQVERISRRLNVRPDVEWKRLDTTFDTVMPSPPNAERLFTFLYGIFPCNVIRFLRAPVDYLRKAEYETPFMSEWSEIIDEIAVQNKAAPILRRHLLHPSLVDVDAESEISDKQRWRDHDAADITAECVCLHVGKQAADDVSLWPESRRPSVIDHLPSLLTYRSASGSVSSATMGKADNRVASGAVDSLFQRDESHLSDELHNAHQSTPLRFYRKRTLSDSFGRRGSVESPLSEQSSLVRRRDLSAQPGQCAGTTMMSSPRILPFSVQSTLMGGESDVYLQNHVKLRYGLPSATTTAGSSRLHGGNQNESLSRSNSIRSTLRTFNMARSSLTSTMMSPTHSSTNAGQSTNDAVSPRAGQSTQRFNDADAVDPVTPMMPPSQVSSTLATPHRVTSATSTVAMTDANSPSDASRYTRPRLKEEVKQTIAYLKQENLQLRNELNYEIGQKDQMLRHIGRIHRDRMKDTVMEDERQNLYQSVRTLRAQLRSVRLVQERAKAEAITSKNRHASWENELNAKLKSFREEKKVWSNEVRQLQIVKEDHETLIAKLEHQLHENANEVFELREQCKADANKVAAIAEYEAKIATLQSCLQIWHADMRKFDEQQHEVQRANNRYEELSILLEAMEEERQTTQRKASWIEQENDRLRRDYDAVCKRIEADKRDSATVHANEDEDDRFNVRMARETTTQQQQDNEDKVRLRARVERLEAELLDAKARQESWQMEELCRRLQRERVNSENAEEGEEEEKRRQQEKVAASLSPPSAAQTTGDILPLNL